MFVTHPPDVSATITPSPDATESGSGRLRSLLAELNTSAGALAALGSALEARASGQALAPALSAAVHGVLDALGMSESLAALPAGELPPMLAELRVYADAHRRLAAPLPPQPGWTLASPELLQAAGDVTAGLPRHLERTIVPQLSGLAERLAAPGARFLDVGAGVGVLSIQMVRAWPLLSVVGIEPWAPALSLARANVHAAGLDGRIELRAESGQGLADEASYDLAWIPTLFIAESLLDAVLARVRRALRAGGWLILPVLRGETSSLASRVSVLRSALWGGSAPALADAAARLAAAGFADVQSFASGPTSTTGLLAARVARAR